MPSPVLRVSECRVLLGGSHGDLGSRLGNPYTPILYSPCQTVHIKPSRDLYGGCISEGYQCGECQRQMHWKLDYIGAWLHQQHETPSGKLLGFEHPNPKP